MARRSGFGGRVDQTELFTQTRSSGIVQADIMAKTNPLEFLQQVRSETEKVTWPTRRETAITTVMVLVMAVASAVFFMLVDWMIRLGLSALLSIGA